MKNSKGLKLVGYSYDGKMFNSQLEIEEYKDAERAKKQEERAKKEREKLTFEAYNILKQLETPK